MMRPPEPRTPSQSGERRRQAVHCRFDQRLAAANVHRLGEDTRARQQLIAIAVRRRQIDPVSPIARQQRRLPGPIAIDQRRRIRVRGSSRSFIVSRCHNRTATVVNATLADSWNWSKAIAPSTAITTAAIQAAMKLGIGVSPSVSLSKAG